MRKILGFTGTTFEQTGTLTSYSPDGILLYLNGLETDADLAKIRLNAVFKNEMGKDETIFNNVPLLMLKKLSDFKGGDASPATEQQSAMYISIGNYILAGDDQMIVTISASGLSASLTGEIVACDDLRYSEMMICYDYVKGIDSQAFNFRGVKEILMSSADETTIRHKMTVTGFYGTEQEDGLYILAKGSALGRVEKWNGFGPLWSDATGLTQDVEFGTFTGQEYLIVREAFHSERSARYQKQVNDSDRLLQHYASADVERYKVLKSRLSK